MLEPGKKKQNFHINLLKEVHRRAEPVSTQLFVCADEPTDEMVDVSHLEQPGKAVAGHRIY